MFPTIRYSSRNASRALSLCYNTQVALFSNLSASWLRTNILHHQPIVSISRHNLANTGYRNYSDDHERQPSSSPKKQQRQYPKFSDETIEIGPFVTNFFPNTFTTLKIRYLYDPDFNVEEFKKGSCQAIEVIFRKLANGQYDDLQGMLDDEILLKLKDYFTQLPEDKRKKLQFDKEEILFANVRDMNIKEEGKQAFVRMDMVYIILFGMDSIGEKSPLDLNMKNLIKDGLPFLINCAFTKECTKGVNDDWTIVEFNFELASDRFG